MSAARELLDDLALIGATVEPAGDRLILRAGPRAIPARLVNRVREAKADLIATLARHEASEQDPSGESQRRLKCRMLEACVVEWLNQHPAPSQSGRCAWCGRPETPRAVVLPFGAGEHHAWLHSECWTAWYQRRREEAVLAMGITRPDTTMIDGVSPASSAAERMRPYPERRTRGLSCITVEPSTEALQPPTQPSTSDGISEDRRGFVGYVDGRFVHYCQCGEWGAHGIGVFLRRGQLGVWYCAEHKPKT